MPVEFLIIEQEARYGQFTEPPTSEQLAKYFWMDDQDVKNVLRCRGKHNRLGFAILLGTVRFLGTFLSDPTEVPTNVQLYISQQLKLDLSEFSRYSTSASRWDHREEIRQMYGYRDFTEQPGHFRLVRWLFTRAWLTAERPSVLFDLATARCVEQKIILPGVSVMARLISQVRDRASSRLWNKLSNLPNNNQLERLEKLLESNSLNRKTGLDTLRQPPTNMTSNGLLKAIGRLENIRSIGAVEWNTSRIPLGRIRMLSRYASIARAQTIARITYERRVATLAFAIIYTLSAQDDVLEIMERFLSELFTRSEKKGQKTRLRTLKDLDIAARKLREACAILLDESTSTDDIRTVIFTKVPKEVLKSAVQPIDTLTRPADQTVAFVELFRHYTTIRKFLPKLMSAIKFHATPAGQQALLTWQFLADCDGLSENP